MLMEELAAASRTRRRIVRVDLYDLAASHRLLSFSQAVGSARAIVSGGEERCHSRSLMVVARPNGPTATGCQWPFPAVTGSHDLTDRQRQIVHILTIDHNRPRLRLEFRFQLPAMEQGSSQ